MTEDPSVDASEWSRAIILAQLGSENSKFQTKELARKLRRQICVSHPIHKYLNDLPNNQLKLVHSKIVDMKRDLNNEQACSRNKQVFKNESYGGKILFSELSKITSDVTKTFY